MATANWSEWRRPVRSILELYPLFGTTTFGADTRCQAIHPDRGVAGGVGPIHEGDNACCMVCHQTGYEKHPDVVTTDEERKAKKVEPYNPDDQWHTIAAEEPTKHEQPPDKPMTRKERRAAKRIKDAKPTDPETLRRIVDGGRGTVMGRS